MPKHQFALYGVSVKELRKRKGNERLLHDFTGQRDDLLECFQEFLEAGVGSGVQVSDSRYLRLASLELVRRTLFFTLESGHYGHTGKVVDTVQNVDAYEFKSEDAPIYELRHVLVVPTASKAAILATEIAGNNGCFGALWLTFSDWFRGKYDGLIPRQETIIDTAAWGQFVEEATLDRVSFITYERSSDKARRVLAREWSVRALNNEVLPKSWIARAMQQTLNPSSVTAFPANIEPEETHLEMTGPQGPRTIVVEREWPRFTYELSAANERSPEDPAFRDAVLSQVSVTLEEMGIGGHQWS